MEEQNLMQVCGEIRISNQVWLVCNSAVEPLRLDFLAVGTFLLTLLLTSLVLWLLVFVIVTILKKNAAKKEELGRIQEAKESSFMNFSHELRTPLTTISLAVSELKDRNVLVNEEDVALLGAINVASKSLLQLINETLDFNKMQVFFFFCLCFFFFFFFFFFFLGGKTESGSRPV
jgi:signal transduction histidine kinase